MRHGSLFSGTLALDMAAQQALGGTLAWVCDNDPGASRILNHRTDAPNLGDITQIDWLSVEPVDVITAGWPCQPFSLAGKREGAADERALWPEVARAVRAVRPRHVVLENVAAIATAGELARAVGDLAALGYVGQWRCIRASDVGAPHGRARIFILATDTSGDIQRPARRGSLDDSARPGVGEGLQRQRGLNDFEHGTDAVADPASDGRRERRPESARLVGGFDAAQRSDGATPDADGGGLGALVDELRTGEPDTRRGTTADADGERRALGRLEEPARLESTPWAESYRRPGAWGKYEPAIRRWERILGRSAPPPTEPGPKGAHRLSPRFEEWMMGLPDGWVTDVPVLSRSAQMKALGNGVVPQQALAALQLMMGSHGGP